MGVSHCVGPARRRPGCLESLVAATRVICARFGQKALTGSEWWLWRMSGTEEVVESRKLVAHRYPHLGRGFTLADERESNRFTIYDGWIPEPGAEIDPTAPLGPSCRPVSSKRWASAP